jgi:hypothetical protein
MGAGGAMGRVTTHQAAAQAAADNDGALAAMLAKSGLAGSSLSSLGESHTPPM